MSIAALHCVRVRVDTSATGMSQGKCWWLRWRRAALDSTIKPSNAKPKHFSATKIPPRPSQIEITKKSMGDERIVTDGPEGGM